MSFSYILEKHKKGKIQFEKCTSPANEFLLHKCRNNREKGNIIYFSSNFENLKVQLIQIVSII